MCAKWNLPSSVCPVAFDLAQPAGVFPDISPRQLPFVSLISVNTEFPLFRPQRSSSARYRCRAGASSDWKWRLGLSAQCIIRLRWRPSPTFSPNRRALVSTGCGPTLGDRSDWVVLSGCHLSKEPQQTWIVTDYCQRRLIDGLHQANSSEVLMGRGWPHTHQARQVQIILLV